jgi:hypothetical protein
VLSYKNGPLVKVESGPLKQEVIWAGNQNEDFGQKSPAPRLKRGSKLGTGGGVKENQGQNKLISDIGLTWIFVPPGVSEISLRNTGMPMKECKPSDIVT